MNTITLFIYGNSNDKHTLLRKTQVQANKNNVYKGRYNYAWFRNYASILEPNTTSIWVQ
jgi:hypothetical protein